MSKEKIWRATDESSVMDQIDRVLGRSRRPVRDDSDLVARVIDFANGDTDTRPVAYRHRVEFAQNAGRFPNLNERGEQDLDAYDELIGTLIKQEDVDALVAKDRASASSMLQAAANDPQQLVEALGQWQFLHGHLIGVSRRCAMSTNQRGEFEIFWKIEVDPSSGDWINNVLAYVSALFLTDQDGCRTNLGYCRLPECGKYFEVERGKPGKPRRDYCSAAHMKAAHERDSARRHRNARDRRKAEAKKKRSRRSA